MADYKDVPSEVLHIASDLISQFHPGLTDCNIGFVFRSEASQSGGKKVFAKTSKIPENMKPLLIQEMDILIMIAEDIWSNFSAEQRKAAIDHELYHIDLNNSGWTIRAHDVEEFTEILNRYGLWNQDLFMASTSLARAVQLQLSITSVERTPNGAVISVDAEKFNQVMAGLDNQKGE